MKKLLFAVLYITGVTRLIAWFNRAQVTILCYHSVTKAERPPGQDPYKLHLSYSRFVEHLDHLRSRYRIISLSDFVRAHRAKKKLPPHSVVLTFDDGFRNFSTVAAKELLSRGLSATIFIVIDKTDNGDYPQARGQAILTDDNSHLSWTDVKRLALDGFEFGSHSYSHPRLLTLPPEAVRKELAESRAALITQLGSSNFALSYPHGQTSEEISRLAESLGYSCGLTGWLGGNSLSTNLFALNRTVVASDDDLATFAARVSGLTWWGSRLLWVLRRIRNGSNATLAHYSPSVSDNIGL